MRSRAAEADASAVRPPRTLARTLRPLAWGLLEAFEPPDAWGGGVTPGYVAAEAVAGGHAAQGGLPPRHPGTA